ncbi:MAG: aspartyl protease family protein [Candidatus Aminicenantes bacterium]|nr:MAG: aspartyl protease family protein [Candidatus Aminicenantes bacterium]
MTKGNIMSENQEAKPPKGEKTRADILAEIKKTEPEFKKNPGDKEIRFKYGNLLYQSGEFWKARDVIALLVQDSKPSDEALSVAAKLEYLIGNYSEAEKLYKRLVEAKAGDMSGQVMANVGLMFTYYQMDRFNKIKELEFPPGVKLPNVEAIKRFEENPYQKEWHSEEKVSIIQFLMTDSLPVLEIEFNGLPVIVFFDTGADTFILDNEIASALGIEWSAKATGSFGGGKTSEIGFGKVDSVKLGDVTLKQVPIIILPTKRFSKAFEEGKYTIGGAIGTAAMRQFLSTIDYKNGRMILQERIKENARKLQEELKGRIAAEVPFVLDATHMMMTRGGLNDKDGLTFFVDSGLEGEACFTAPIQTLNYVGIPVPETKIDKESVGGGGGKWASGIFPIKTISMGSLIQSNVKGTYGARPPESYWGSGYIQDGLISHRFLRQYSSWTLDFDAMKYIFEK